MKKTMLSLATMAAIAAHSTAAAAVPTACSPQTTALINKLVEEATRLTAVTTPLPVREFELRLQAGFAAIQAAVPLARHCQAASDKIARVQASKRRLQQELAKKKKEAEQAKPSEKSGKAGKKPK